MEIGSRVWAVRVAIGLKKTETKKIKKARDPYISPPRGGATADTIPTKLGRIGGPRDLINLAKLENKRFIIVTSVSG